MKHSALSTALAVFLALLMLLSLAGCTGITQLISPTPTPTATPTVAPTPTAEPTPTPEPTPSPTPEPSLEDFVPGVNDEQGYHSDFFRFGFRLPLGYANYDRSALDEANGVDSTKMSDEEFRRSLIMQLKMDGSILDFASFYNNTEGYVLVFVTDFSDPTLDIETEADLLASLEEKLTKPEKEERKENLVESVVEIGAEQHTVFLYDVNMGKVQKKGATFAIKRGTTFAIVQVLALYEGEINYFLDTLYSLDES